MPDAKFWSPVDSQSVNTIGLKTPKKKSDGSKLLKIFGVIFGVLLLIVLAVAGIGYVYIIKPGQILLADVNGLKLTTKKVQDSLIARDFVATDANLLILQNQINTLRKDRDAQFSWAKSNSYTSAYYSDSEHFVNAGLNAIDALQEAMRVVKPFADAAGIKVADTPTTTTAPTNTNLLDAFSQWISVMPKVADDMDGVIARLDKVGVELKKVDANRYPEEFNGMEVRANIVRYQNLLSQVGAYGPDIKQALTIVPGLLGVGTLEKRYMIIMQNDKELRATGGFWTNYATFKIKNGLLSSDFTSKDMYSIDNTLDIIDATFTFPKPPVPLVKYLLVERWYARDSNYSPDLPTSIDQFMYSYKIANRISPLEIKLVDGIFVIDTQVVRELLSVTGPVTVNGLTYNPDNVVYELEKIASLELREQANRKKVLGELMGAMLVNVFESDKDLWSKLIEKGIDLAIRKHISAYVFDPAAQALLEKYSLAGRIIDPVQGDYVYNVSTNLGGDKTNWFVSKEVSHYLAQENGKWVRTEVLKYSYPQPNDQFLPFVKRFRDFMRVYTPMGTQLVSIDGSLDATGQDQERNKIYYFANLELGPGESKTLTYKYILPDGIIKDNQYSLYIQKQPGIDTEKHSVYVNGKLVQALSLTTDTTVTASLK